MNMLKKTVFASKVAAISFTLSACDPPNIPEAYRAAEISKGRGNPDFQSATIFSARQCIQALAAKARGLSLDPSTGFTPIVIERYSYSRKFRAGMTASIRYRPGRLNADSNWCLVEVFGSYPIPKMKEDVTSVARSMGYQVATRVDNRGRQRTQFVKGNIKIQLFSSRITGSRLPVYRISLIAER